MEDLRDVFSVSYEMAAHRFTNLATHHLGLPCHFVKNDEGGIIYKAYENDGVVFPADATGAIEGQRMCRQWSGRQVFAAEDRFSPHYQYSDTPSGTYWCAAFVDQTREQRVRDHPGRARTSTRAGSAAGRPSAAAPRPARTGSAASVRRPGWRRAGRAGPGRRRGRTRTSCRRCRPAASPASTRPTCSRSSNATRTSEPPAGQGKAGGRFSIRAAAPSLTSSPMNVSIS